MEGILKHYPQFNMSLPEILTPEMMIKMSLTKAIVDILFQNPEMLLKGLKEYPELAAYLKENL